MYTACTLLSDASTLREANSSLLAPKKAKILKASLGEQRAPSWFGTEEGGGIGGQATVIQPERSGVGKHNQQGEEDREAAGEASRESHTTEEHYYKAES